MSSVVGVKGNANKNIQEPSYNRLPEFESSNKKDKTTMNLNGWFVNNKINLIINLRRIL